MKTWQPALGSADPSVAVVLLKLMVVHLDATELVISLINDNIEPWNGSSSLNNHENSVSSVKQSGNNTC